MSGAAKAVDRLRGGVVEEGQSGEPIVVAQLVHRSCRGGGVGEPAGLDEVVDSGLMVGDDVAVGASDRTDRRNVVGKHPVDVEADVQCCVHIHLLIP